MPYPKGLCERCRHVRKIVSDRGSQFTMCLRSRDDARFPKYPRLPVTQCSGFEQGEDPMHKLGLDQNK